MANYGFPITDEQAAIVVHQGAGYQAWHKDVTEDGTHLTMDGWTGVLQVRDEPGGALVYEGSTADGRLVVGLQDDGQGNTWNVLIDIPAPDTDALPAGYVGRYEVKLTDTSGRTYSYLKQSFCVDGEIAE